MRPAVFAASFLAVIFLLPACQEGEKLARPVEDPQAAARAFRLYYRERSERAMLAYQRFALFGAVTFGVTMGKVGVARQGERFELVPGPTDNNMIGISVWTAWRAWRIFGGRFFELALLRMLNGLRFFEQITGHPGLTSRMTYPGWTMHIDGKTGTVALKRGGADMAEPVVFSAALRQQMLQAFFSGAEFLYRLEPDDFLFDYMPAVETGPYATTYSFSMLPRYLRSSDCCASLMRTPAPYTWQGAFWGNHNSRDNFPDLSLGLIAARRAAQEKDLPTEVREAAELAAEAGQRIGDLVVANDAIVTVDEHHDYDTLVPSGQVRPDGETEAEDLGTMADCQMAFLARAISSSGLSYPPLPARAPASIEYLLMDVFGSSVSCQVDPAARVCRSLDEAFCGETWATMDRMTISGTPWLDLVRTIEEASPGSAEGIIGSFQDDFYEITLATLALVEYADAVKNAQLAAKARQVLGDLTALMRQFADIIYKKTQPARYRERMYEAALFEAWGGFESPPAQDLGQFEPAERQQAALEAMLVMADTAPETLKTQAQIDQEIQQHLASRSESVKRRYAEAYGAESPVRVTAEGYQARGYPPEQYPWRPVQRPYHRRAGGFKLLFGLVLCETAPRLLDCAWAKLGCRRPDLDANGKVDGADGALFEAAAAKYLGVACGSKNDWCEGADLDRTGKVDDTDRAFMQAAEGCWY